MSLLGFAIIAGIGWRLSRDTLISPFIAVRRVESTSRSRLSTCATGLSGAKRSWTALRTRRNFQASWSQTNVQNAEWLSPSVLAVKLEDMELASRLGELCFKLEAESRRRTMSNMGGFQSSNLAAQVDPALSELMSLMHEPLAAFLWRLWRGSAPKEVSGTTDLTITSCPEHIWANINRPGHYNRLHEHGPPMLCRAASGIYYPLSKDIDRDYGDGGTVSSNSDNVVTQFSPLPAVVRLYDGGRLLEVKPEPGLLLLFPTTLLHEVDPSWPGSSPRASMAFNLFVRWLDDPLLRAACSGNVSEVQQLMQDGLDANHADAVLGFRAAHIAAEAGHLPVLKALAAQRVELTAASREGWSPLGLAAAQGHLSVVQYLTRSTSTDRAFTRTAADAARDAQEVDLTHGFAGLDSALTVAAERGHQGVIDFLHGQSTELTD